MTSSILIIFAMLSIACGSNNNSKSEEDNDALVYQNPVIRHNCPDPTVIDDRSRTGYFYLYSTQSSYGYLPIYRSKNLVDWEFAADGFGPGRPQWVEGAEIWAPDITYYDGKYILYYAMGVKDIKLKASGVAISDSPTGPFIDHGMVVSYQNTGVCNCIDPNLFIDDDGKKYLIWGGYWENGGIYGIELSDDCLSVRDGAKPVKISLNDKEGAYVVKRNGYYYLFASMDLALQGANSKYHVVVARSKSPLGPYFGPNGESTLEPGYDNTIISSSPDNTFRGPGHDAQIITDDDGQDWMAYHSYWSGNGYNGRCLNIDKIIWEDGWPRFDSPHPTKSSAKPEFKSR